MNKKIQNKQKYKQGSLFDESVLKATDLINHSYLNEGKVQSYLSRFKLLDMTNNRVSSMEYSREKEFKKRAQVIRQKVFTIEHFAKDMDLIPIFLTFTLPTWFHPFNSKGSGKDGRVHHQENPNFIFKSIDEAIAKGYKQLNKLHQKFYRNVKHVTDKNCLFVKMMEPHKSIIPHMHCLYFVPKDCIQNVYDLFERFTKKHNVGRSDFQLAKVKSDVTYASSYLLKYITKSMNKKDTSSLRLIDGWCKKYKIRIFSCSQLPINSDLLDKLYRSTTKKRENRINSKKEYKIHNLKDLVRGKVVNQKVSFYYYFLKNTRVEKQYFDENGAFIKSRIYGNKTSKFKIKVRMQRIDGGFGHTYKILNETLTYRGIEIHETRHYRLLRGGNNS